MSIETLLEAAKYVELSSSIQPTRGGDGGVITQTLPASTVLSTETRKSAVHISPPRTSSKHLKVPAGEKKKEDAQQQEDDDYYDEMEFSSSGNLSNSDFSGDWSDKRRQGGAGTREVHNKLEKNRRAHLKECFESLRYQIPNMQDHKVSNLSILRGAFRFVQILKRKEKELELELDRLVRNKIEMQSRLVQLRTNVSRRLDTSDKIKLPWHSKGMGKKSVKKAERKRKAAVHHHRDDDDDGASTSTASETEEEERRSRAHSPVAGSPPIRDPNSRVQLQAMVVTSTPPRSLGHASVIQSTGQPKQQLKVVPRSFKQGEPLLLTTVVVDNGHSVISKGIDEQPLGTDVAQSLLASSLRPTVSQLLNKNADLGKSLPMKVHGAAPKLPIIHTGNQAGIKQHSPLTVTHPKISMSTNQTGGTGQVLNAPPGIIRNGSPVPTLLASALTGHLMHPTIDHIGLAHVSVTQPNLNNSLITSAVGQPVMASLPTQNIFKTGTARPGLAGSLHAPYKQIPFSPAMTQVLLTQPSIAAYTLARPVPFSHTIIRQTPTPVSSRYASSSTSPVTIMTTSSQKTIVSPKSTSPGVSLATNTVTKEDRVDRPLMGASTLVVSAPQTVSGPCVFSTTYLQATRPGIHRLPLQQPAIGTGTTTGTTPILKAYRPVYIPKYRTIGSVVNVTGQRPLVSGVAVAPKFVTQAGNGSTATIIVQPSLVNTTDKPQH